MPPSHAANPPDRQPRTLTSDHAWKSLLALADIARRTPSGRPLPDLHLDPNDGRIRPAAEGRPADVRRRADGGWGLSRPMAPRVQDLFELYLPLCGAGPGRPVTVGHLGQSLDGQIATATGDSCFVTGRENIVHLHRMRALSDAVVVGASTVAADDPRLTTRLVPGGSPVRVVLDTHRRLAADHRVFTDGGPPTLLICDAACATRGPQRLGTAEVVGVPVRDGTLALDALLATLRRRGLHAVFVEGGGVTVSAFLVAGLLDRLQLALAPVLIGAGRPGLQLPAAEQLRDCLRPSHRIFRMGADVLFDCDLRSAPPARDAGAQPEEPVRIL